MNALRQATQNVSVETPCPEPGCVCDIPANKPPFTPWVNVNVSGGFFDPGADGRPGAAISRQRDRGHALTRDAGQVHTGGD